MKNSRLQGIIGTVVIHLAVLLLLFFITIKGSRPEEEGGVPVMLGNTELAQGDSDPYTLTEVDVMDEQQEIVPEESSTPDISEQEMITQEQEETVVVKPQKKDPEKKTESKKKEVKKTTEKKLQKPVKTPEEIEAEKKAAAEKAAAEEETEKIAGAFGKGSHMGNKGSADAGKGLQGSSMGNGNVGKTNGVGGLGSWDLNGRSLNGNLPVPVYNVQDEGRVVVTITVNPSGKVINTSINKRTNTVSTALRRAAEDAARKARFNTVEGVNNQTGTITYYFKLK